jgi:hypothetical protein
MEYSALVLAILGGAIGLRFRLRFVLGVAVLVLAISLVFVVSHHYSFGGSLLVILGAQTLLQGGYFAGLVGRALFPGVQRKLNGLSASEADRVRRHRES